MRALTSTAARVQPVTTNALAGWRFNRTLVTDNATDAVGTYTLTQHGSPGVQAGVFSNEATFSGIGTSGTQYFDGAGDAAAVTALLGQWTVRADITLTALTSTYCLVKYGYSGGVAANDAQNTLMRVLVSNAKIQVIWQQTGQTFTVCQQTQGEALVAGVRTAIAVRKRLETGGTYAVDIFIRGRLCQTFTGLTNAAGGSSCSWFIGRDGAFNSWWGGAADELFVYSRPLTDAEILLDATGRTYGTPDAVFAAGSRAEHMRVQVKDSGGTFRDLTTYPGFNAVRSAEWREDLDSPHATATVTLHRELDRLSLAPLITDSALNRGFDPAASYAALLDLNREIKIQTAVVAMDKTPASGDWITSFHGYIDTVDPASGYGITIEARDLGSKLAKAFIETERVYSYAAVGGTAVALRIWEPSTAYALNEYLIPTEANRNGKFYKVTTAGTSGATEPTWPGAGTIASGTTVFTFQAATTTSGNAVEQIMQNLLDDTLGAGVVTLYTPVSPSWNIRQYIQKREPLLDALRTLALQIGWDVRYKWRAGTAQFELTFDQPDRSKTLPDWVFGASDYPALDGLKLDISGIRNVVRVVYSDRSDLLADGSPKRKTVTLPASTSASITRYGRLFMEIAEDSASQIDSSTEATLMATNAVSDLQDPKVEQSVTLLQGFPWVELGDLFRFLGNARHYTADQDLAVFALSHKAQEGRLDTSIQLRGKPSIGFDRWRRVAVDKFGEDNYRLQSFDSPGGLTTTLSPIVGGARATVAGTFDKGAMVAEYEHHLSPTSPFTPSSSSLVAVSKANTVELGNLLPGTTYYHRTVPRSFNGNRIAAGSPSSETSFVAGRAAAGHIAAEIDTSQRPLNGGFESRFDTTSNLPDHWTGDASAVTVKEDSAGYSGNRYIRLTAAGATKNIYSGVTTVRGSTGYRVDATVQGSSGADTFKVSVEEIAYDGSVITTVDVQTLNSSNYPTWTEISGFLITDPTCRFVRLRLQAGTGSHYVDFDEVRITEVQTCTHWEFYAASLDAGGTVKYAAPGAGGPSASEGRLRTPIDGILDRLYVEVRVPSTDVEYLVELLINGATCGVSATVTAGGSVASDIANATSCAEADGISFKVTSTATGGGPVAGSDMYITLRHRR